MPIIRKFYGKENESNEIVRGEVTETREVAK
jgi:hypothetical protein